MSPSPSFSKQRGFTLIELLTVIAIIGILAAIIIPTVGAVRVSANKAKTKVQFGQWAAAISSFKLDYGFYPNFSSSATPTSDTGLNLNNPSNRQMFVDVLSGKKPDGTAISGTALTQNKRRASYYSFSDADITFTTATVDSIKDAFENIEVYVIVDYNYDELITTGTAAVKAGISATEVATSTSLTPTLPTGGVRAGVVFYSPGKGATTGDIVTSW